MPTALGIEVLDQRLLCYPVITAFLSLAPLPLTFPAPLVVSSMLRISGSSLCQVTPDHRAAEQEGWRGLGPGEELALGGLGQAKDAQLQVGPGPLPL